MVSGNDLNNFFTAYNPVISGIGEICGILGFVGSIILGIISYFLKKKTDIAKKKANELEIDIKNLKIANAQFTKIINNYGLSLADTKIAAEDVFNEKAKNMHNIYIQDKMPDNLENGDIWFGGDANVGFGDMDEE